VEGTGVCCTTPGNILFVPAGADASASEGNNVVCTYSTQGGDKCGVTLGSRGRCYSISNDIASIPGASVGPVASKRRRTPMKIQVADRWVYRNASATYTIPIDSEDGRHFASLESTDNQIDLLVVHGTHLEVGRPLSGIGY
jgi:hypothetical protein